MKLTLPDDPYSGVIRQFVLQSFPNHITTNAQELIDALTDTIVATGSIRYGPRPSPESLVAIRQVLARNVTEQVPLRFISPWGSEKPNGTGIDIAELMALKTFICLNDRVKKFYSPGIEMRLKIEDVSAPHLFYDRMEAARAEAKQYCDGLDNLIKVMGVPWIFAARESLFITEAQFNTAADAVLPLFEKHLAYPSDTSVIAEMQAAGWSGGPITADAVSYYMKLYDKLYPEEKPDQKLHRVARYFGDSLVRKQLGLSGKGKDWGDDFMEIYFNSYPQKLNRIHYRVMPSNITSAHMPPWRAKGFLRVAEETVTASVASWQEEKEYNPFVLAFERDGTTQNVAADYIIV
jgi:hypothetical protein